MRRSFQQQRKAALRFLASSQRPDGSWPGLASFNEASFIGAQKRPTIFFSAIITDCLASVTGSRAVCRKALRYVQRQASPTGTWNYWQRAASHRDAEPYPDDLDDTACALAACSRLQRDGLTGTQQANLANALISVEQQPGGPYNTWLIDSDQYAAWKDIDIAVNANIAYVLRLQQTSLAALDDYLTGAIITAHFNSSYYCGEIPVIYFLSRACPEAAAPQLANVIAERLKDYQALSALQLALLVSSACRLALPVAAIQPVAQYLSVLQTADGSWPAAALYYEPVHDGRKRFAGSRPLTTAFCLEALSLSHAVSDQLPRKRFVQLIEPDLHNHPELSHSHQRYLGNIIKRDRDGQITRYASSISQAHAVLLTAEQTTLLNSAGTYGWLTYTLLDDALDEQVVQDLPLAFSLERHMVRCFSQLGLGKAFIDTVESTLLDVEAANQWEMRVTRHDPDTPLLIAELPDYGDLDNLAARSFGHFLVPTAVLLIGGYDLGSPKQLSLRNFFQEYLIAKQLNDDAHDWEEDMLSGRINAVAAVTLQRFSAAKGLTRISLQEDLLEIQQFFWQDAIGVITAMVLEHIARARQILQTELEVVSGASCYDEWLLRLETAAERALTERDKAASFITAFNDAADGN